MIRVQLLAWSVVIRECPFRSAEPHPHRTMKSTLRTILSTSVGLALFAAVAISCVAQGFAGDATVLSFALLVVYGLFEIAVLSYLPTPAMRSHRSASPRSGTHGKIDRMPVRVVQTSPSPAAGRRRVRREISRFALVA